MSGNIMQYESKVWSTADSLIGAGIKQSDFPKFMMPFFALVLVESRLLRMKEELEKSGDKLDKEDFLEEIKEAGKGYNKYLFEKEKTLIDICKNDKTFEIDFDAYLKGFDGETKDLLGIDKSNEEERFLDISGICGQLKKKKIFFAFVKGWSEIDLKPFNNSEITTLEEHIKRKWADISAETAGEQYTPDDVISLISEIVNSKIEKSKEFLTIYDPSCGGGNLLFGVEDRIKESSDRPIATYGQDWSDSLYALAKIESRFRENSSIEYGNTLTSTKYYNKEFDVVVANPPHGITWKDFAKDIYNDKTGQFQDYPSTTDGQLLFNQHIVSRLNDSGFAVIVHNGSALFSGDAGSGESNIRKWLFDKDFVEAIIQLPSDEFFNTGIFTYLWIINKSKPKIRQKNIMLIDASNKYVPLKKNKGEKRKEMDEQNRKDILRTFLEFKENDYSRIFNRDYFYFNKQIIKLTNLDVNGNSFNSHMNGKDILKLEPKRLIKKNSNKEIIIDKFLISDWDKKKYESLSDYYEFLKQRLSDLDYEEDLIIETSEAEFYFDNEKKTLIKEANGIKNELGCGKILIKPSYKKSSNSKKEMISITVELTTDYEKDYEIIPYIEDEVENKNNIKDFLKMYIKKPYEYLENTVGVEINFNKVFYKLKELRELKKIIDEIKDQNKELQKIEEELEL
ncbi:MAG: N-6 DNA methylase [Nanoarchaeota archaeon]